MDNKKIKIAIVCAVMLIIILTFVIVLKKSNQSIPEPLPQESNNNNTAEEYAKEEFETTYQNVVGTIISIDSNNIEVVLEKGNKINLSIPSKSASFMKTIEHENGEVSFEEIGLFDIAQGQLVDIQYNTRTNEVMLIVIK